MEENEKLQSSYWFPNEFEMMFLNGYESFHMTINYIHPPLVEVSPNKRNDSQK